MTSPEFSKSLEIEKTNIPGLLVVHLPVHGDNRGWFKENWQREKLVALGFPEQFTPVQNNISFNVEPGTTRGLHAEPWNKYVSVATGEVFGAWVDLREGESFGETFSIHIDPSVAVFVPRGVANGFQALQPDTAYTYLVDAHWKESAIPFYTFVNLADETAAIDWPIPLDQAELSDKDRAHPRLGDVTPMKQKSTLITGADGQLGTALRAIYPDAEFVDRDSFDISSSASYETRDWSQYGTIINAAAFTAVDAAETVEGREAAWSVNSDAVRLLAHTALKHGITLVHISSDYVFDGTKVPHQEDEKFSPLGVYGQSKAAGDIAASLVPQHYLLRTTWVVGDGNNFVKTMKGLAEKGADPNVVNDQLGRLTFTEDLAAGIKHLLDTNQPYGTYNLTNDGDVVSWADIAKETYKAFGHDEERVTGVTTEEYYRGKEGVAPRPLLSEMSLDKIKSTGYQPRDWREAFAAYVEELRQES